MERILIIGCSGSGKTTLARKLGEKLKLPVVHLDRLWWTGNWENVTREEFDARFSEELEKQREELLAKQEREAALLEEMTVLMEDCLA